ncbi:MAG: cadmium-translocating P-type ATPase [Cellvibrionaceae bacterium]|nr:cadmium-translocating P-type ATPase [Cellvibrionaceae bacterium]
MASAAFDTATVRVEHSVTPCFHCGLPVADPTEFTLRVGSAQTPEHERQEQSFCCVGCQAVTAMIYEGGLGQFYRFRTRVNQKVDAGAAPSDKYDFSLYDQDDLQADFVQREATQRTASLLLDGITCAACVWLIERHLSAQPGVLKVRVNGLNHRCELSWDASAQCLSQLMQALAAIGYQPQPFTPDARERQLRQQHQTVLMRLGVAGFGMMQVGMTAIALYAGALQGMDAHWQQLLRWLSLLVATPVVLYAAQPFWSAAWRSLRQRRLTMDVSVSTAIILAYVASAWATLSGSGEVYFDSVAMFTFFLLLGRYAEMRLRRRNQSLLGVTTALLPRVVERLDRQYDSQKQDSQTPQAQKIPLSQLAAGDRVRLYAGDTIPCDGRVCEGDSRVVEALLTGEAEPVVKGPGDAVIAGTLNTQGVLIVEVTAVGKQTRLSTIERLVQQAQQHKPRLQQLADKIAAYFVAVVLLAAAAVFIIWQAIRPEDAFWISLSVLVVSCPCALSLATPTALTAAVAALRRRGLLVVTSHVIETLPAIEQIIFDKTGTLTQGQPSVKQVLLLEQGIEQGLDAAAVLALAAALETGNRHPIAQAFTAYDAGYQVSRQLLQTGAGVSGVIGGHVYALGKPAFVVDGGALIDRPTTAGQWLLLAKNARPLAWIALQDSLRSSAVEAVTALQQQGQSLEILSGDQPAVVAAIAEQLGGLAYHSDQSPEDKLALVRQRQQQRPVLMVGDGINDMPVLAGADVSIAMESATDLARTSADAVLLRGDLTIVPAARALSLRARRTIKQNLGWALAYNTLALPLAACGFIPPYLAAIGMSLSSLIVIANALRLR